VKVETYRGELPMRNSVVSIVGSALGTAAAIWLASAAMAGSWDTFRG
jgi:hypothetical protein